MENLITNLEGRIRNTVLAKSNALFPLFEAVVNSIQSIDDGIGSEKGRIEVKVIREPQGLFSDEDKYLPKIIGFEIIDNGTGFNDENYKSFQTLDTVYKSQKGCKGIGRLLWLKVFEIVKVESIFKENDSFYKRTFNFSVESGISNHTIENIDSKPPSTKIIFSNIRNIYSTSIPQKTETIAQKILQHCLWYFIREGNCAEIKVSDAIEETYILLQDLYDRLMLEKAATEQKVLKGEVFEITNVKLSSELYDKHALVLCAACREVQVINLKNQIKGLFGALSENEESFFCYSFITGKFLDENVVPERAEFNIPDEKSLYEEEISLEEIKQIGFESVQSFLKSHIDKNQQNAKEKIIDFVEKRAPQYKPFIKNISNEDVDISPDASEESLDLMLHKKQFKAEEKILKEGHKLLNENIQPEKYSDYEKKLEQYLQEASDYKQAELAKYVSHRRVILDFLKKAMEIQEDGKYVKEKIIHQLIFPMRKTDSEVYSDSNNLWLINERLVFNNYLASDKPLSEYKIIETSDEKRPDVLALQVFDEPILTSEKDTMPLASINVIEFKKPMRNDMTSSDNPINQALGYLDKVRKGKCMTKEGRPIPESENIPGFCYIIADITESLKEQCRMATLTATADKLGYFGYNANYKAYIEVISFDQLYSSALERNQAFFQKLGLPNT